MHWAAHGHTAAEIMVSRADAAKDYMGLASSTLMGDRAAAHEAFCMMTTMNLTEAQVADMMAWSPEAVSRIRHVYVDQTAVHVARAEQIRRSV
jgi:hypothetical protein